MSKTALIISIIKFLLPTLLITVGPTAAILICFNWIEKDLLTDELSLLKAVLSWSTWLVFFLMAILLMFVLIFTTPNKVSKTSSGKKIEAYLENVDGSSVLLFFLALILLGILIHMLMLVNAIISHKFDAINLLKDAGLLWLANLIGFTHLYWWSDAGGAFTRIEPDYEFEPDNFVFTEHGLKPNWKPNYLDYFYLAFNFSTAFSVTDTPVVSRKAKICTMVQFSISLITIGVMLSRAINILAV